ncbi:GNAT family N-acetyltransferase [soil metagenome]
MDSSIQTTSGLTPEQLPQAIALFDTAFERKMSLAIADVTVRRRFFGEIFSGQACLGALKDGQVIGAAGFQTPTDAFSGGLTGRGIPWSTIRRHLGFFQSIRAALFFKLYERETDAETLLMDGIFVNEAARGLGIGRTLLEAIITYGTEHGFKKVKLGVIDTNPRAKALYERVGFVVQAKKNMGRLKWLLGFGSYYIMIRPIEPKRSTESKK